MKRLFIIPALIVSLVLPLGAHAVTVSELQAQIQSLLQMVSGLQSQLTTQYQTEGVSSVLDTVLPIVQQTAPDLLTFACPRITSSLGIGSRDGATYGAVSQLQQYLVQAGVYPEGQITGYYGPLTARAVARLQAQYGLDPVGVFGPQTRALVARMCGAPDTSPVACTMEYNPVCGQPVHYCRPGTMCAAMMPQPKTYSNRCILKAENAMFLYDGECNTAVGSNKPPVVSGISGPTVLSVGETGTWSVTAYDPESGSLSYQIDWGDVYASAQLQGAYEAYFKQTSTFAHSYSTAGTYTVRVSVRDDAGHVREASTTVRVSAKPVKPVTCTREYNPVCGQPAWVCPVGFSCPTVMPDPKTYGNLCMLEADGAEMLYPGECTVHGANSEAPASCKLWYDGCNNCSRSYPGGPLACTLMYCFQSAGAFCRESF